MSQGRSGIAPIIFVCIDAAPSSDRVWKQTLSTHERCSRNSCSAIRTGALVRVYTVCLLMTGPLHYRLFSRIYDIQSDGQVAWERPARESDALRQLLRGQNNEGDAQAFAGLVHARACVHGLC
jgi:hypothetical protein